MRASITQSISGTHMHDVCIYVLFIRQSELNGFKKKAYNFTQISYSIIMVTKISSVAVIDRGGGCLVKRSLKGFAT